MKKFMPINLQIQMKLTAFQTNMLGKLPAQELIIIKINLISYTILSYLKNTKASRNK